MGLTCNTRRTMRWIEIVNHDIWFYVHTIFHTRVYAAGILCRAQISNRFVDCLNGYKDCYLFIIFTSMWLNLN